MPPIIYYLHHAFPELVLPQTEQEAIHWVFADKNKHLEHSFYRTIVPKHLDLELKYSLLRQQLAAKLRSKKPINTAVCAEQLISALVLAELLEHFYSTYIPGEVAGLRQQKQAYQELLHSLFPAFPTNTQEIALSANIAQNIRARAGAFNLYRVLYVRSKRILDVIALFNKNSTKYLRFVGLLARYSDPIFANLAWMSFIPRLSVNLTESFLYIVPGWWMKESVNSLGVLVRFKIQMNRCGMELIMDTGWLIGGLVNRFYLTQNLAPLRIYVSLACFTLDLIIALARAFIELSRLYKEKAFCVALLEQPGNEQEKILAQEQLNAIKTQISFEEFRLGSQIGIASLAFLANCCALPIFLSNPLIPLMGAISLVTLSFINFDLIKRVTNHRAKENIKQAPALLKLGFYSQRPSEKLQVFVDDEDCQDDDYLRCI